MRAQKPLKRFFSSIKGIGPLTSKITFPPLFFVLSCVGRNLTKVYGVNIDDLPLTAFHHGVPAHVYFCGDIITKSFRPFLFTDNFFLIIPIPILLGTLYESLTSFHTEDFTL